jgi:hypothetical protein
MAAKRQSSHQYCSWFVDSDLSTSLLHHPACIMISIPECRTPLYVSVQTNAVSASDDIFAHSVVKETELGRAGGGGIW